MTYEKTYEVQEDHRLIITLPAKFKTRKQVRVIIEEIDESRSKKIYSLKKAAKDPLYLTDTEEIASDFIHSDNELR